MVSKATIFDSSTHGSTHSPNARIDRGRDWGRNIFAGTMSGLWVWFVYGVVEFILACATPLVFQPDVELLSWQWRPIALLFGVYLMVGLTFGSFTGAFLAWIGGRRKGGARQPHRFAAALTLVVVFAVNLARAWPLVASEYVALAIAVALGAVFAAGLVSSSWLISAAFLANPGTLSLLLLTAPWVSRVALADHSTIQKVAASFLMFGAVILTTALWRRVRPGRARAVRWRTALAGAAIMLSLSCLFFSTKTRAVKANLNSSPSTNKKPNVLLITMDTVRADHLSVYGYGRDTTPNLRDFARQATLYTRAIAASDVTLTSHASIFTGLYPSWHGAYTAPPDYPYGRPLATRYATLAEALRSQGYWTAAEVANSGLLTPQLGMARGFALYQSRRPVRLAQVSWEPPRPFYLRESARRLLGLAMNTTEFDGRLLRAADINRHAVEFLNQAGRGGQPFFLFLNYMDAHGPYSLPRSFETRFSQRQPPAEPADFMAVRWAVDTSKRKITPTEGADLVAQYDAGIAYEDQEIGNLFARLRELGLYENTLIIITGDHGDLFGEHDLVGHALGFVYQGLIHIPLLIRYPRQHEALQSDALVSHIDLMPTVLGVIGCAPGDGIQGRSLQLPRAEQPDAVYSEAFAPVSSMAFSNPKLRGIKRSIIAGSWKLITWTEGPPELYDLAADPNETHDLFRADNPRALALADRLMKWPASAPRQFEKPAKLDKNSFEKLKSLGYAQ